MTDLNKEAKAGIPGTQDVAADLREADLTFFTMLQQRAFWDLRHDRREEPKEQQGAQCDEWTHSVHGKAMQGWGSHRGWCDVFWLD
mmetsp:Transcript_108051/g.257936  ORF Transcript_108051/g.257936 Transcript_108051/m.257936 type:complete len:86 (-) Transcript_108051:37-294(-)